jgi:hypothetical protein
MASEEADEAMDTTEPGTPSQEATDESMVEPIKPPENGVILSSFFTKSNDFKVKTAECKKFMNLYFIALFDRYQ